MRCPTPSKVRFKTTADAERYVARNRKARGMRPYWCRCGKVHLTSDPEFDLSRVSVFRGRHRKRW